jgi:hypothetical protein
MIQTPEFQIVLKIPVSLSLYEFLESKNNIHAGIYKYLSEHVDIYIK